MTKETGSVTATVEIFEPPMCCPTGLCGPVQDQTLLDLVETVRSMESAGVKVARYQPNTNPTAFTNHAEVMAAVRVRSTAALPITVVKNLAGALMNWKARPLTIFMRRSFVSSRRSSKYGIRP